MDTSLYIGIDIGKRSHYAAFLSKSLLKKHKKHDACPTAKVDASREGFVKLLQSMTVYAPADQCHILLESTGHYGRAIEQFLQEAGCNLYRIQGQKRYSANKTDKSDAQALAALLYNQVGLHVINVDEKTRIAPLVAPGDTARQLRGLVQHRSELVHESTQRKNKLTALCDELFPEMTSIYADPNSPSALTMRAKYPTPGAIMNADIDQLCATRLRSRPSRDQLIALQELATATIGTHDESRIASLILQQGQLIAELNLLTSHIAALDETISASISQSREGQILTSFNGIGPVQAAALLSGIGSIANFESAGKLRGYMGWAPRRTQTGTSIDSTTLNKSGNALLKQTMYLVVMNAIQHDETWKALYTRMVEKKCAYDAKSGKYKGRMKVLGHVAGEMIEIMYVLLRKDYDLLSALQDGQTPPAPQLYDPLRHHQLTPANSNSK